MEKKDIVKLFLDKGIMLEPDALNFLYEHQEKIEYLFENISPSERILTKDKILFFLQKNSAESKPKVRIVEFKTIDKITTEHIVNCLSYRLDVLTPILKKKPELHSSVSIAKIRDTAKSFSTIGLVKEIEEDKITIEDKTGHIDLHLDRDKLSKIFLDEVIGVKVIKTGGMFFIDKIFKPDVPIFRPIGKLNKSFIATSEGLLFSKNERVEINLKEISTVYIDGFFIIYLSNSIPKLYGNDEKTIIELLKGRNLHPTLSKRKKFYKKDPFLLEKVPDLIIIPSGKLQAKNYKGVTIVFLDKEHGIKLPERKTIKIE